jgi:hypothetical protein
MYLMHSDVPLELATRIDMVAYRLCHFALIGFFHTQLDKDINYRPFRRDFTRTTPGNPYHPLTDSEYSAIYETFSQAWNSRQLEIVDISDDDSDDDNNDSDEEKKDDNDSDHEGFEWKEPENDDDNEEEEENNQEEDEVVEGSSHSLSYSSEEDNPESSHPDPTSECEQDFVGTAAEEQLGDDTPRPYVSRPRRHRCGRGRGNRRNMEAEQHSYHYILFEDDEDTARPEPDWYAAWKEELRRADAENDPWEVISAELGASDAELTFPSHQKGRQRCIPVENTSPPRRPTRDHASRNHGASQSGSSCVSPILSTWNGYSLGDGDEHSCGHDAPRNIPFRLEGMEEEHNADPDGRQRYSEKEVVTPVTHRPYHPDTSSQRSSIEVSPPATVTRSTNNEDGGMTVEPPTDETNRELEKAELPTEMTKTRGPMASNQDCQLQGRPLEQSSNTNLSQFEYDNCSKCHSSFGVFNAHQLYYDFKKQFFNYEKSVKIYDTSRCSYTFNGYGTETAEFDIYNTSNDPSVYLRDDVIYHMLIKYDRLSYIYAHEVFNTRVKLSSPDDPTILSKKKKVYEKDRCKAAKFKKNRMVMILDTGSQIHLFSSGRFLRNRRPTRRRILDVNGGAVEIDTEGDIGLLENVLVSSRSPRNIISGTLLMQMGLHFYTTGDYLFICDKDNNFVSMGRRNKNNLIYMRDMNLLRDNIRDELVLVAREDTIDARSGTSGKDGSCPNRLKKYGAGVNIINLLHNRFGHLSEKKLKAIAKNGSIKGLGVCFNDFKDLHLDVCDACIRAKMRKLPVKPSQSNNNEERKPFEKVGADIVGKVQVKSIHGNHYFVFYVDYKTNYTVAYFIAKKNELLNTLEELESNYIKFYGHEMKVLQSDSEAVFKDEKIANWCTKRNIRTHLSPPYLHEANGKAERNIQTVVEMARTYMISSNAPPNVWEYAVALAVHNLNLTPRASLNWKSPHELVTGEVPDISHLIPFYAKGWAYKYKDEPDARQFKFGELASNVRFLGYSKSSRNAFIVKTLNGKIMLRRDCQFDEHPLGASDIPEKTPLDNHTELDERDFPEEQAEDTTQECGYSSDTEKDDPSPVALNIRPQRERKKPERYGNFVGLVKEESPSHDIPTPVNCRQALDENNPHCNNWRAAICAEMEEMYSRGSIVDVTMEEIKALGRKPFQAKFVFKVKVEPDGSIKFKARLVVKGFTMIQGLDYDLYVFSHAQFLHCNSSHSRCNHFRLLHGSNRHCQRLSRSQSRQAHVYVTPERLHRKSPHACPPRWKHQRNETRRPSLVLPA